MLSQGFNLSPPHPTEFAVYFCKILSFQQNFRNFFKMFSHFCRETSLFVCKIFAFLYFTRVNEMRKKLNIYETIYLETLVWKTQYGNPSMETLIWKSQYGNLNMEILVWKPSYGNPSLLTLLWKPQYGNLSMETSMETLVWKPQYGNPS